jgi:hypothetical protein
MVRILIELFLLVTFVHFITKDAHFIVEGIVGITAFVLWVKSLDKRG